MYYYDQEQKEKTPLAEDPPYVKKFCIARADHKSQMYVICCHDTFTLILFSFLSHYSVLFCKDICEYKYKTNMGTCRESEESEQIL